jgi:hypothetical protein
MPSSKSQFSASEQALGYLYQLRYALFKTLDLSEETLCFVERDDDIDFTDPEEGKILASLKHKAAGDSLTDLSPDFWKSVRIWLNYYLQNINSSKNHNFYLFTTGRVAAGSLLESFLPNSIINDNLHERIDEVLKKSTSKTIDKTRALLYSLPRDRWMNFFRRISIFDGQERIENIPIKIIKSNFRPIRPQFREPIYERLEGWWISLCIDLLTGKRKEPISGEEVSQQLSLFTDQFRDDNLPIDFANAEPDNGVNPDSDERYFVKQLKAIGLRSDRLKRAILDYYRAFQQRGSWVRENVIISGELEQYDDRLTDEWVRLREIIFEDLDNNSPEELLKSTGRKLLNILSTNDSPRLRVRTGVTATFVTMGSYHMLANNKTPRIYWHPKFKERMNQIFSGGKP